MQKLNILKSTSLPQLRRISKIETLFRQSTGIGGEKYEYLLPGSYIGELTEFEKGRLRDNSIFGDIEEGKPENTQMINWKWNLYQADGVTPVMHEGNQVVFVAETSDATTQRSTAAKWFAAHLKRPFDSRIDKVADVMAECIGKKAMLIITNKINGYKKTDVFESGV